MNLLGNDITVLVILLSFFFSFVKVIKVKHLLWALGINIVFLIPIFLGYEYRYFIIKEILYLILIFFIGSLLFKPINTSKSKPLKVVAFICVVLLGINSFRDGISYHYRVDVDPINLDGKYLIARKGAQLSDEDFTRYNMSHVIYKYYWGGILRKYIEREVVEIDEHTFEHQLEDGGLILYKDGVYSIIFYGDDLQYYKDKN